MTVKNEVFFFFLRSEVLSWTVVVLWALLHFGVRVCVCYFEPENTDIGLRVLAAGRKCSLFIKQTFDLVFAWGLFVYVK